MPTRICATSSIKTSFAASSNNSLVECAAADFAPLVRQIWAGPRINEYLSATDGRRHIWHACLSSPKSASRTNNQLFAALAYKQMTFLKGEDLIEQAYGCRPAGIVAALGKLGARARFNHVYHALIRVMAAGGPAARFLQHQKLIPDETIVGLSLIPPRIEIKTVINMLKKGDIVPETLSFLVGTLAWFDAKQPDVAEKVAGSERPVAALWEALQSLPFPSPPWPESRPLIPVVSRTRLLAIATDFQNCLSKSNPDNQLNAVMSVINGNRYFYELRDEPALLEFVRIGPLGWYLRQISGPRNETVSDETRDHVLAYLATQASFRGVWGCLWSGHWNGCDTLTALTGANDSLFQRFNAVA